jgi:ubiquinol-cytochrome c reductase cytochrome b subunit
MFFYPYYFIKDLLGVVFVLYLYLFLITLVPDILGHADNYIKANALSTPVHIVPEWYFLPFYAVLRSLPDKAYGALLLILSILSLFFLPLNTKYDILSKSGSFKPPYKYFFGIFATNFIVLG